MKSLAGAFVLLLAASVASAQDHGGGASSGGSAPPGTGGGGPVKKSGDGKVKKEELPPVKWATLEDGASQARSEDKILILYVHSSDLADPSWIGSETAREAATQGFVFAKREYNAEDREVRRLKITSANVIVGLDRYGNDFGKRGSAGADTVEAIVKGLPPVVAKFKQKVTEDFARAAKETDEKAAIKIWIDIVETDKRGYPEIVDSVAKLREIFNRRIKAAEAAGDAAVLKALKDAVNVFKGSPPAAAADVRLARIDHQAGNIAAAVSKLVKTTKLDEDLYRMEINGAAPFLAQIVAEGVAKIDSALIQAKTGSVDAAKKALAKIAQDYKGTDVETKAADELKKLG